MMTRILDIWTAGGWVMWPLLVVSLLVFGVGLRLWLDLQRRQFRQLTDAEWQGWVHRPEEGQGEVGELIRYVREGQSSEEINRRFAEVTAAQLPPIDRRLSTLGTLVAAAPLVGLLGTVFGMLVTFQALAAGGGGQVTEAMADGISQALFPPEVGLCIALPGLVLANLIRRQRQEFEAFLARIESYTIQHHRRTLPPARPPAMAPNLESIPGLMPAPLPA